MKGTNHKPLALEELMKDSSNVSESSVSQRTSSKSVFQGSIRKYAVLVAALPLLAASFALAQPTTFDLGLDPGDRRHK